MKWFFLAFAIFFIGLGIHVSTSVYYQAQVARLEDVVESMSQASGQRRGVTFNGILMIKEPDATLTWQGNYWMRWPYDGSPPTMILEDWTNPDDVLVCTWEDT